MDLCKSIYLELVPGSMHVAVYSSSPFLNFCTKCPQKEARLQPQLLEAKKVLHIPYLLQDVQLVLCILLPIMVPNGCLESRSYLRYSNPRR
jgi:hypothetical protein